MDQPPNPLDWATEHATGEELQAGLVIARLLWPDHPDWSHPDLPPVRTWLQPPWDAMWAWMDSQAAQAAPISLPAACAASPTWSGILLPAAERWVSMLPSPGVLVPAVRTWIQRQAVRQAIQTVLQALTDPQTDPLAAWHQAHQRVTALADPGPRSETALQAAVRHVEEREMGEVARMPLGFVDLDAITGGLEPGSLWLVAARPGVGKSTFALNVLRHWAERDPPVPALLVTLEMSASQVVSHWVAECTGLATARVHHGRAVLEEPAYLEAIGRISTWPHRIWSQGVGVDRLDQLIAREVTEGMQAVVVDYVQLVERPADRRLTTAEAVGQIGRRLKQAAMRWRVPVLAMAQLNRQVEHRDGVPVLADLRDSGQLEADADGVLLLWRDRAQPDRLHVKVAKQRMGPLGSVVLRWVAACTRLEDAPPEGTVAHA